MKVLVLAGGYDQIALIKELKERGHSVILADYLENPPAKNVVSRHYKISTLDEMAVLHLAKTEKVDLITTACTDQALMTVARVSKMLNLPCYIDEKTALDVTNKAYMKQKFIDYGIPTAKSTILDDNSGFSNIDISEYRFPIVVKPCDCNSSKGVKKVNQYEELNEAIQDALRLSRNKKVIVEEFLEGIELSIDVWKDSEDVKIISISTSDKIENNDNSFAIYKSHYPVFISKAVYNNILKIARKICNAFDLDNCPILIQAMLCGDRIEVIEFSARMGGGSKYKLIEYMSGIDIMKTYVNRILGDTSQVIVPIPSCKFIEVNYVYAFKGIFDKIVGIDKLLKEKIINDYFLYKESGSMIDNHITSSDRVMGFLIQAETLDELNRRNKIAIESIDILDCDGRSIMMKNIFKLN